MESLPWDATQYDEVSRMQQEWGRAVLGRIVLAGDETVLDAGCGTCRLAELIAESVPRGRVLAVDVSQPMLSVAKARLASAPRITFVHANLMDLPFADSVDVVFSNAVFHWVPDHDRLFASIARSLRRGGRLVAQCGGAGNNVAFSARCMSIAGRAPFARYFEGYRPPFVFATPEETEPRLRRAGFTDIQAYLSQAPTVFPNRAAYRAFCVPVVLRSFLMALPPELHDEYTEAFLDISPGLDIDYVRLNIMATTAH